MDGPNRLDSPVRFRVPFVRRLIPAVATAVSLAGCGVADDNGPPNGTGWELGDPEEPSDETADDEHADEPDEHASENDSPNHDDAPNHDDTPHPNDMQVGDGEVSSEELLADCREWKACDASYFDESFGSVDECVGLLEQYLEEELAFYEEEPGSSAGM